jgi:hypothetical protein
MYSGVCTLLYGIGSELIPISTGVKIPIKTALRIPFAAPETALAATIASADEEDDCARRNSRCNGI